MGERQDDKAERWIEAHPERIDVAAVRRELEEIIARLDRMKNGTPQEVNRIIRTEGKGRLSKSQVLKGYRQLVALGEIPPNNSVEGLLKMKPTRTLSGVAPVAVLTKPHPCTGTCIFCPDLPGVMPTSYLPNEPGARRAAQLDFDPYRQTERRIHALENIGHTTAKIELIILGGTWSRYPEEYQAWFIKRCLDGMNRYTSSTLEEAQRLNEDAASRNVGMVIETRPDCITPREVVRLRRYGVTKVQMGIQSLDDAILERNKRGHDVEEIRSAFRLLRAAGFKIHVHWMPNLLGATPESDLEDFAKIWDDHSFRPDELKLYPCMVVAGSELYDLWKKGEYTPYSTETLIDLLAQCKKRVPPYCRITRVMRDIPSSDIIAGCSYSNLRQMVRDHMHTSGNACGCIRCREVRRESVDQDSLVFRTTRFETDGTEEYFIAAEERDVRPGRPHPLLAGFLRLSLPTGNEEALLSIIPELRNVAMVREVHVYGPSLALGSHEGGRAQHIGLGTELLNRAEETAKAGGFNRIAVISAIGTRGYYRKRGYVDGEFYLHKDI